MNHEHDDEDHLQEHVYTVREYLDQFIHSQKFHIAVVVLVLIDIALVFGEIFIDLKLAGNSSHNPTLETLNEIFHFTSIAILTLFMVELCVKFYVMRLKFFHHKMEVFDGVVVVVSFIFDIILAINPQLIEGKDGLGLLIILRLWRVARIISGIVITVKSEADQKIHKLKHEKEELSNQLTHSEDQNHQLLEQIERLHALLLKHGISEFDAVDNAVNTSKVNSTVVIGDDQSDTNV